MRDYTHKIEDVKEFFNNYDNSIELKIEDLDRLKEIMLKKQKELTDAGKEFINLHLFLVGFDVGFLVGFFVIFKWIFPVFKRNS